MTLVAATYFAFFCFCVCVCGCDLFLFPCYHTGRVYFACELSANLRVDCSNIRITNILVSTDS